MGTPRATADFFAADPTTLARRLLGQRLVHLSDGLRLTGIIVETEAYLGVRDRAAHTYGGRRTPRNASMWRAGGHAYVYLIYGLHRCLNVVAGAADEPVAVLIRALRPETGIDAMFRNRAAARRESDLCSGPGKLCQALGIDRRLDGTDLTRGPLVIELVRQRQLPARKIAAGPRIGVDYAGAWAAKSLRFAIRDDPNVSSPAPER
jgi:DNA-3-methyladenine glycosylase